MIVRCNVSVSYCCGGYVLTLFNLTANTVLVNIWSEDPQTFISVVDDQFPNKQVQLFFYELSVGADDRAEKTRMQFLTFLEKKLQTSGFNIGTIITDPEQRQLDHFSRVFFTCVNNHLEQTIGKIPERVYDTRHVDKPFLVDSVKNRFNDGEFHQYLVNPDFYTSLVNLVVKGLFVFFLSLILDFFFQNTNPLFYFKGWIVLISAVIVFLADLQSLPAKFVHLFYISLGALGVIADFLYRFLGEAEHDITPVDNARETVKETQVGLIQPTTESTTTESTFGEHLFDSLDSPQIDLVEQRQGSGEIERLPQEQPLEHRSFFSKSYDAFGRFKNYLETKRDEEPLYPKVDSFYYEGVPDFEYQTDNHEADLAQKPPANTPQESTPDSTDRHDAATREVLNQANRSLTAYANLQEFDTQRGEYALKALYGIQVAQPDGEQVPQPRAEQVPFKVEEFRLETGGSNSSEMDLKIDLIPAGPADSVFNHIEERVTSVEKGQSKWIEGEMTDAENRLEMMCWQPNSSCGKDELDALLDRLKYTRNFVEPLAVKSPSPSNEGSESAYSLNQAPEHNVTEGVGDSQDYGSDEQNNAANREDNEEPPQDEPVGLALLLQQPVLNPTVSNPTDVEE